MVRFRALRGAALAVVAVLLAAACGTTPTAPQQQQPAQPPPQPAAFSVVSTSPANGQTEVPLAGGTRTVPGVGPVTGIVVEFNAPVDNQPGSGGNPCVANVVIFPAPVAGPTGCTVIGQFAFWTGLVLRGTTTYTITIPAQVGAADGRILGSNYTFSFTTRTGQLTNAALPLINSGWASAPNNGGQILAVTASPWVGDCESNTLGGTPCVLGPVLGGGNPPGRIRAFAAFGIPGALLGPPVAAVQNATLTVSLLTRAWVVTDPFNALLGGPLGVVRVDYLDNGVLDQADYAMGPVGQWLVVFNSNNFFAPASVDVTGMLQTALATPPTTLPGQQPYLGLRFEWGVTDFFGKENTDGDGGDDMLQIGNFVLQVTFWH